MAAPCALFASCSDFKTTEFVKRILDVPELPTPAPLVDGVQAYKWNIETKYYSAEINLCTIENRTIGDKEFAESVQAFVVHFNNNEVDGLKGVNCWLPFLDQLEAEIKILVCNTATDSNVIIRLECQKWCIEHGFELVELEPEEDSDSEDDFQETTGIKRIVQALKAHTWSNLELKENPDVRSPYIKQLMKEESENKLSQSGETGNTDHTTVIPKDQITPTKESNSTSSSINKTTPEKKKTTPPPPPNKEETINNLLGNEEQAILAAIGQGDPEQESFEQLFEKLKVMKDKAESLPLNERKAYAEKVAISFWRAIGGDEDEIDGLSDSDGDI